MFAICCLLKLHKEKGNWCQSLLSRGGSPIQSIGGMLIACTPGTMHFYWPNDSGPLKSRRGYGMRPSIETHSSVFTSPGPGMAWVFGPEWLRAWGPSHQLDRDDDSISKSFGSWAAPCHLATLKSTDEQRRNHWHRITSEWLQLRLFFFFSPLEAVAKYLPAYCCIKLKCSIHYLEVTKPRPSPRILLICD